MTPEQLVLNADQLRALLTYDPTVGTLTWKPRDLAMFNHCGRAKLWNARFANRPVCLWSDNDGYARFRILGRKLRAHRVIWMLVTGDIPDQIDHINGDRSDNRWTNLRSVSVEQNNKNKAINSNNSSGVTGVYWDAKNSNWRAKIRVRGRAISVGSFALFEHAVAARKKAELLFEFSPTHGRKQCSLASFFPAGGHGPQAAAFVFQRDGNSFHGFSG